MPAENKQKKNILAYVTMSALFLALIILTFILFNGFVYRDKTDSKFNIDMISPNSVDKIEISDLFVPEFIGISLNKEKKGISYSIDTVSEIFSNIAPSLSCIIQNGVESVSSEKQWRDILDNNDCIYIRFHSQYSLSFIKMFCDELTGNKYSFSDQTLPVHEIIIVPYSDSSSSMALYVKNFNGEIKKITADDLTEYLTVKDLEEYMKTYSTVLIPFNFNKGYYKSLEYSQPVYLEAMTLKNIIITNNVASILLGYKNGVEKLLDVFNINVDKVAVTTSEEDTVSYLDTNGIVYAEKSSYSYKAINNGIDIRKYTENKSQTKLTLRDYVASVKSIVNKVRDIESSFFIGRGELFISDFSKTGDRVEMTLSYSFENIPILNVPPAVHVVIENDYLISAEIYTISIKDRANKSLPLYEWGFINNSDFENTGNAEVYLCYDADLISENVSSEWVIRSIKH